MAKYYSLFGGTTTDTEIQVAKENQIVISEGPGAMRDRLVIYKVEHDANGYMYHLVNLETKAIRRTDILRPYSRKFGIGMYYTDADGQKKLPYIIHRTSLGCYERTLAYLIETYAGALPTWMAPEQVRVLPVTDRAADYAGEIRAALQAQGYRAEADYRSEKLGYKIREAQKEKIPYMVIVGDKDLENHTVSIRHRSGEDLGAMSLEDFSALLKDVVDNKKKQ